MRLLLITVIIAKLTFAQAGGEINNEGFAVVKNDTIYGEIKINFDYGSIVVKQDSVNRMFLNDIQCVTILNEVKETYYTITFDNKPTFFKALVEGDKPLFESNGKLYTRIDGEAIPIDDKILGNLFGKKEVKDYAFVRNISLEERSGLITLFKYFNNYKEI